MRGLTPGWRAGALPALAALLLLPTAPPAATAAPSEYAVKAAFLLKFADYVEWPDRGASGPFVVAVLGADPFGGTLDAMLAGKEVKGRPVAVRRYTSPADAVAEANILFVGLSDRADLERALEAAEGRPVLTVGDSEHFASRGGIVGLRLQGAVVRFDINLGQAERSGLRISSQLLKLARIVRTGSEG
jgi:hypothetical protein